MEWERSHFGWRRDSGMATTVQNRQSHRGNRLGPPKAMIESISALTRAADDMARAVKFYAALGFDLLYRGPDARFSSFRVTVAAISPVL